VQLCRSTLRFLTALFLLTACATTPRPRELTAVLEPLALKHGVPALAAAIARSDGPIVSAATGVRSRGAPGSIRANSRFHVGSVTKPMTATMLARLVEQGKLSWSTTIGERFPDAREEYRGVTLADLLAHEGGIPPFTDDAELAGMTFTGTPAEQRLAFAKAVLQMPRGENRYSNAGFTIAAVMAEEVTGRPWEDLLREHVFEPLGLRTAGFGWPAKRIPSETWGHIEEDGKLVPHDPNGEYQISPFIAPAGDVHMSMEDLARFLRAHLVALRGTDSIVKTATAKEMHTKRTRSGLGFGVAKVGEIEPVSTYTGSAGTFLTLIAIAPRHDLVVAVSANAADAGADAAARAALKELLAKYARK